MSNVHTEFIAVGGNRQSSAADWAPGLLAFGAGNDIALWDPNNVNHFGVSALLHGHTDTVNAVKVIDVPQVGRCILSASSDGTVRIWKATEQNDCFKERQCLDTHKSSVNTIAVLSECRLFASGAADGTVQVWELTAEKAKHLQSISLKPRFLPLALAFTLLDSEHVVLAVAGTTTSIQLFARKLESSDFHLQASLSGHDGWIRSIEFVPGSNHSDSDVLLASASQDRYIRLWRVRKASKKSTDVVNGVADLQLVQTLSNKVHTIACGEDRFEAAFEALLIGHEDWIYTVRWASDVQSLTQPILLSTSADNSLAIWGKEASTGLWVCRTRLGDISAEKGATTATGSTGGLWIGLWSPDSQSVACLGRTGSWRRWTRNVVDDCWVEQLGITGHTQEVRAVSWAPDGSYLLSTSSDQTTRLFAAWSTPDGQSWHEYSRPQIHGYDLNCITSLTANRFVSGADEKLLRVFDKPKVVEKHLLRSRGEDLTSSNTLPEAANIPVLGLSNKAITEAFDEQRSDEPQDSSNDELTLSREAVNLTADLDLPPFEDRLARHTLWPEHEKLYGHGYEISAVTANHSGTLLATACKASSLDHAVIRVFETREWREIKPVLTAHSLTVTHLAFSYDDRYLLSVGRDRQWALFMREDEDSDTFQVLLTNPKGHSRMILDCSWANIPGSYVFATAGRDKVVKFWRLENGEVKHIAAFAATSPVTSVAFSPRSDQKPRLAYGTEQGDVVVVDGWEGSSDTARILRLDRSISPTKAINGLAWQPTPQFDKAEAGQEAKLEPSELLSIASEDGTLRILRV